MEEETYYVNVREPADTRKKILETSRQVVMALQKYENFKLKKLKKQDMIEKLRKNFREINELILRLRKEMPQVKARKKASAEEEQPRAAIRASRGKYGIDDLEKELNAIENKLQGLK